VTCPPTLLEAVTTADDGRVARVLVTERLADAALESLGDAGHDVDLRLGLTPEELLGAVSGAAALIVRSATQVSAEVLDAGRDLVVVGRAGVGVDNIDLAHADANGVLVVNAPDSNIISAAEHAFGLLLAQARNIPQAHMALTEGRWERSRWTGVELSGKTLGIVGFGRIGRLVAVRAQAFGMHVVATDPYVSPEQIAGLGVELVDLAPLFEVSDFVTLHVARTPETMGLVDADVLSRAKPGLRVLNVSRGGIVDEQALAGAIREGRVAGAAIDVFETEPTTSSPLFDLPGVVVTPHLGASTGEAQDRAGRTIAEQVVLALAGKPVRFAVNTGSSPSST
jgi:D-3-phosphoglycerate dehydrogenase